MCGIAGFARVADDISDENRLRKMGASMHHRGPDASGTYVADGIGLVHQRLSIIDLNAASNQPMHSLDQRFAIVFNGEIYNYLDLRAQLTRDGYQFATQSDTEVILALFSRDRERCLDSLNGMFAFAIWDKQEHTLFMARDRIGKKPLYYYQDGQNFVFGSEIKSILASGLAPDRSIRADAVRDFFAYHYIPDPKTVFQAVHKLPPASYMWVRDGRATEPVSYWDVSFAPMSKSPEEASEELDALIEDAVKLRMISDVPLGAFLSGGIDSSLVVELMARNSSTPITTCSIGFTEERFNEIEFAKMVADQFATDHHEFTVQETVQDNLEKIAGFFDEPFADSSFVPTYFVSQLARQKVTVALAGDGGDENFAGYSKYAVDQRENELRKYLPMPLARLLNSSIRPLSALNMTPIRKALSLTRSLGIEPDAAFYQTNSTMLDATWETLALPSMQSALQGYHPMEHTRNAYRQADAPDHLGKILYTDIKTYLPGDILTKVDRMSMANSLEVRAPLLDYRVVEMAASLPSCLKMRAEEKKFVLKELFKARLPHDILYRKKMGFAVPLAQWLRTEIKPLAETLLFTGNTGLEEIFDMQRVRTLWNQHQAGVDHANALWACLTYELWWRRYMCASNSR